MRSMTDNEKLFNIEARKYIVFAFAHRVWLKIDR